MPRPVQRVRRIFATAVGYHHQPCKMPRRLQLQLRSSYCCTMSVEDGCNVRDLPSLLQPRHSLHKRKPKLGYLAIHEITNVLEAFLFAFYHRCTSLHQRSRYPRSIAILAKRTRSFNQRRFLSSPSVFMPRTENILIPLGLDQQ